MTDDAALLERWRDAFFKKISCNAYYYRSPSGSSLSPQEYKSVPIAIVSIVIVIVGRSPAARKMAGDLGTRSFILILISGWIIEAGLIQNLQGAALQLRPFDFTDFC